MISIIFIIKVTYMEEGESEGKADFNFICLTCEKSEAKVENVNIS